MKIESLAPSAQPDGPLVCTLETGERLKVPPFLAADLNLYAGRELSEDELSALRAAIARARTRQRAVRILSSTAISRAALEKRLTDKGAVPEDALDTVQWLDELHLLDDAAVAEQLVQSAVRKGYGRRRIEQILYEKRIPHEYWQDALAAIPDMDGALDSFLHRALDGKAVDDKLLKRTTDALLRRGHSWSDIRAALARYRADLELSESEELE